MIERACQVLDTELWELVDTSTKPSSAGLLVHLEECVECRDRLAEIRQLHSGLEAIGHAEPADIPKLIGGYRILRVLGQGGMGVVYEAEQEEPRRRVALKVLRPLGTTTERHLRAFRREIQALGRLSHPSIATVFDAGRADDGQLFLVMELVDGQRLDVHQRTGDCQSVRDRVDLVARISEAVHHAHQRGVLHRDLKPGNVIVDAHSVPHVLDFGLARFTGGEHEAGLTMTVAGSPLGTLPYMSPEQLVGAEDEQDVRTDVYSLGVMLYELLVDRLPYPLPTGIGTAGGTPIPDPATHPATLARDVSRELGDVVMKAIAPDRERRYSSAAAFAEDLRHFLAGEAVSARPQSVGYRLRVLIRRHKMVAATVAATLLLPVVYIERDLALAAAETREAQAALDRAGELLVRYRGMREEQAEAEAELVILRVLSQRRYLDQVESARLADLRSQLHGKHSERQHLFTDILGLTKRASQESRFQAASRRLDSDLYIEKVIEIRAKLRAQWGDWIGWRGYREDEQQYLQLARETDPSNPSLARLEARFTLHLTSDPPGAEIHLFRYENLAEIEAGGDPRLVPVPFNAAPADLPIAPGTWGLRPLDARPPLDHGDVVVEVDGAPIRGALPAIRRRAEAGNVRATVLREGRLESIDLAPGTDYLPTARPLVTCKASLAGVTPVEFTVRESRTHLLLVRSPDHEEVRILVNCRPSGREKSGDLAAGTAPLYRHIRLRARRSGPPGFVLVPVHDRRLEWRTVWMQPSETTCAEYLEFLNDPSVQACIESPPTTLVPRHPGNAQTGGVWRRAADGRFLLPSGTEPDHPVIGVSWFDAKEFAAWRTRRAREAGLPWTFDLPSRVEWDHAALGPGYFVWGDEFHPQWVKSCFSTPEPCVEPVMSYPIDESAAGILDVSGSAAEWLDAWLSEDLNHRLIVWGSWAQANAQWFRPVEPKGREPHEADDTFGFRLVARSDP